MPHRLFRRILRWSVAVALFAPLRSSGDIPLVQLDYFFEAGCPACAAVEAEVLPALDDAYAGLYEMHRWDIGTQTNYLHLVAYQKRLRLSGEAPVTMVVDRHAAFQGVSEIRDGLLPQVGAAIEARLRAETEGRAFTPGPRIEVATVEELEQRVASFTWPWVAMVGLTDGLNPCAFTTIVFLTSLLATGGRRGKAVFLGGLAFCLASFVTYFLIGLGMLSVLDRLEGLATVRRAVEWGTVAALAVFGVLSLRDAWRYARTGDARSVTLQLPDGIKRRIRSFARARWQGPAVFGTGLVCGAGVTLLESVCTGQLYLPTLVVMSREGGGLRAWGLLVLYNVAFVVPLFGVFLLGAFGVRSQRLADWTRRHVVPSKLLLAGVFLALAILLASKAR